MAHSVRSFALALAVSGALVGGAAHAQSGLMPMPPSASDPLPRSESAKPKAAPRKPARTQAAAESDVDASAAKSRSASGRGAPSQTRTSSSQPRASDRIDTRPRQEERQLEIDSRAVSPVIQNGRAGVGMRF